MKVDVLRDRTGLLAWLVNCDIQKDQVLCGFACFRGGMTGAIEVIDFDSDRRLKVIIPESVEKVATYQSFADSKDLFQVERAINEAQV